MENETFLKLIPPTITLIVTSLFGLLIGIMVEKFKNRIRLITYTIRTQKITPPLSENLGGQLKITLNSRVITTLRVTTIEIENQNNIDLENVFISFSLFNGGIFQGNEGYLSKTFSWLAWAPLYSDSFGEIVNEFSKLPVNPDTQLRDIPNDLQKRIDYINANREYLIPIFNRKEKAVFNFLVEDPNNTQESLIYPTIVHKSVKFIKKADVEKRKQRDLWISIGIGIIYLTIVTTIIALNNPQNIFLIVSLSIFGFSYSLIGYLALFSFRKIKSFFS
jgi:hypothetical protein